MQTLYKLSRAEESVKEAELSSHCGEEEDSWQCKYNWAAEDPAAEAEEGDFLQRST